MAERPNTEIVVKTPDYHVQAHTYLNNTFAHLQNVNGHQDTHTHTEIKPAIEAEFFAIANRNEGIAKTFQSSAYLEVVKGKEELKGPSHLAVTGCMDGRFDVNLIGKTITTYKTTGGIMEVERRGDGKIIPKPAELCVGIQKTARSGRILTQGGIIHTKCAAASEIQRDVNANKPYMPEIFNNLEAQYRIGKATTPEEANLYLVKKTTLAATNDLYNTLRTHEGFEPLARTGFTATYDLETRGLVFSKNGCTISTAELSKQHSGDIGRVIGKEVGEYGIHQKDFYDPQNLLTIAKKSRIIIATLMNSDDQNLANFQRELRNCINGLLPDFLPEQKQAVEFLVDTFVSKQYLAGLDSNHLKRDHGEQYISSSRYGEYYGYRDTEQVLGCRVPDPETAGNLLPLQLKVLRGHIPADRPKIYIVGSPADTADYQQQNRGMDRSRKECLDFFKSFIRHENVAGLVKSQKLIPVPVIFDENGGILEIPDFSYVV